MSDILFAVPRPLRANSVGARIIGARAKHTGDSEALGLPPEVSDFLKIDAKKARRLVSSGVLRPCDVVCPGGIVLPYSRESVVSACRNFGGYAYIDVLGEWHVEKMFREEWEITAVEAALAEAAECFRQGATARPSKKRRNIHR